MTNPNKVKECIRHYLILQWISSLDDLRFKTASAIWERMTDEEQEVACRMVNYAIADSQSGSD